MNHSVEITKEAALKLIGNDETRLPKIIGRATSKTSFYLAHGVRIAVIHNYLSNITQYFIQDINA